jgi:hypothetical protein
MIIIRHHLIPLTTLNENQITRVKVHLDRDRGQHVELANLEMRRLCFLTALLLSCVLILIGIDGQLLGVIEAVESLQQSDLI